MNTSPSIPNSSPETHSEDTTAQRLGYFIFAFGMFVLTLSFLTSCNTTRGLGRDMQHVGSTIEHQAARVQSGQ